MLKQWAVRYNGDSTDHIKSDGHNLKKPENAFKQRLPHNASSRRNAAIRIVYPLELASKI
jgi:hypothetical protein